MTNFMSNSPISYKVRRILGYFRRSSTAEFLHEFLEIEISMGDISYCPGFHLFCKNFGLFNLLHRGALCLSLFFCEANQKKTRPRI